MRAPLDYPRRMPRRALVVVLIVLLVTGTAAADEATTLAALARSLAWLKAHAPDPNRDQFGFLCLDAWSWCLYAADHPDARIRTRTGARCEARLRALSPPPAWTDVSLSYWALALRLMAERGMRTEAHVRTLSGVDLDAVLARTDPTTAWWTRSLLQHVGVAAAPDAARTFIATHAAAEAASYVPRPMDAYQLYHEIAPAAALGGAPLAGLSERQVRFAQEVVGDLITGTQGIRDTDATAEALIAAALLGRRALPAYGAGIAWLRAQQQPDGTYRSAGAVRRNANDERHAILVASWALLTSLDRFQPAVAAP